MIEQNKFFNDVNNKMFNGKMTIRQRDGIAYVLKEWEMRGLTELSWLAYILATFKWETNSTMQPVREAYWLSEDWRRENLRYYPYYGRGPSQMTWESNYRRMTEKLKGRFGNSIPDFDMVKYPDQALIPDVAMAILFEGMLNGNFTGMSLAKALPPGHNPPNFIKARTIINGTDRAVDIAAIAQGFYQVLTGVTPKMILHYGMSGQEVRDLQENLHRRGLYMATVDGDFGPATLQAVKLFQQANNLTPDGIVGDMTYQKLERT